MKNPVQKAVIDVSGLRGRGKGRGRPKGRQVDPRALADVRAVLGDAPRRRDLLIEHLDLRKATRTNAKNSLERGPLRDWWREGVSRVKIIE